MNISYSRSNYGTAVFLELGELLKETSDSEEAGEAAIMLEWSWRIENSEIVLAGSFDSKRDATRALEGLTGVRVSAIEIDGNLPELIIRLSNQTTLRSFTTSHGSPQWMVFLPDGTYLFCYGGKLLRRQMSDSEEESTIATDEQIWNHHARQTAQRWGSRVPAQHPAGHCSECAYYQIFEADGPFVDYGVCSNFSSVYDGSVVSAGSGCALFATALGNN
jgi:hypothetical protein